MALDYDRIREAFAGGQFSFALAVPLLKRGHRLRRQGWNGKNMWVRLLSFGQDAEFSFREGEYAEGTLMPFLVLKTPNNQLFPWNPSQEDIQATDWEIEGPVYLFALYDGPEAHKTLPTFRVTLRKVWEHRKTLDDAWLRHPHLMLSPRFSRLRDATYVFDGPVEDAVAEMFSLSWESPEDFRAFVSKG